MAPLADLLRPPPGMDFDFTRPAGEPALAPKDGVAWKVFANPVSLFIGGVAAVLLELAEPSVRAGVWDHSSFRRDPAMRLRRTGFAAMMTIYGPQSQAREMIAQVVAMHERVSGTNVHGDAYRANNPELLDWVQATATFGFTAAYDRYVRLLSAREWDAAFAEGAPAAKLYGARDAPVSAAGWEALLSRTAWRLEPSDVLSEFLAIMNDAAILSAPLRPLQRLLLRAAVSIVPEPVRRFGQLRGRGLRAGEALAVRAMAGASSLIPLPTMPAAQARRRLTA
jgi:uncharacterized protein (DUF2236 family)